MAEVLSRKNANIGAFPSARPILHWCALLAACVALVYASTMALAQAADAVLNQESVILAPASADFSRAYDCHLSPNEERLVVVVAGISSLLAFEAGGPTPLGLASKPAQPSDTGLRRFGWRGDTLWVADPAARTVTLYDSQGERVLGAADVPRISGVRIRARPWALLSDGALLELEYSEGFQPESWDNRRILHVDRTTSAVDTLTSLNFRHARLVVLNPGAMGATILEQPWADNELWAVSATGDRLIMVDREVGPSGAHPSYGVRALTPGGRELFSVRVDYGPVKVTRMEIERRTSQVIDIVKSQFPSEQAAREAVQSAIYSPRHFPPVTALTSASDGSIWIEREEIDSGRRWDVLSGTGRLLMRVRSPRPVRIVEARGRTAWGVAEEGGGWQVIRFRISVVSKGS